MFATSCGSLWIFKSTVCRISRFLSVEAGKEFYERAPLNFPYRYFIFIEVACLWDTNARGTGGFQGAVCKDNRLLLCDAV
jgi:hypothetical protein